MPALFGERIPQIPPANTVETVILSLNSDDTVTTSQTYSGIVELVFEGAFQREGEPFYDLFYQVTDEFKEPLENPIAHALSVQIDNQDMMLLWNDTPQDYNAFHVYRVPYSMQGEPRTITFQLGEAISASTDTLRIYIVDESSPLDLSQTP
jgi:hypothetical protein